MNYFDQLILSLVGNIVLLFCLFQPNIVRWLHQNNLDWNEKYKEKYKK